MSLRTRKAAFAALLYLPVPLLSVARSLAAGVSLAGFFEWSGPFLVLWAGMTARAWWWYGQPEKVAALEARKEKRIARRQGQVAGPPAATGARPPVVRRVTRRP